MSVRIASHSGTWYSDDEKALTNQIQANLEKAQKIVQNPKAIIVPHAGYEYCSETAAWAWCNVDPSKIKRVFILGPSHHKYLERCAIPKNTVESYSTPFGNIPVDQNILNELRETGMYEELTMEEDLIEHSIEMMLPFLKYIFKNYKISIIPIVVGSIHSHNEIIYAQSLFKYFGNPQTLFVISSDFCHWGRKFRYTYVRPGTVGLSINDTIQQLDLLGAELIERQEHAAFNAYLRIHGNTICGRHPIGILLHLIEAGMKVKPNSLITKKLHYSQSASISSPEDSCVAYCSIITEVL